MSKQAEFIRRAEQVHAGKGYDYSCAIYVNSYTKLTVKCQLHGDFKLTPKHHLQGRGCRHCGIKTMAEKRQKSISDFIDQANYKHNGLYDYSKTKYASSHKKITILCKTHGAFVQSPSDHLKGRGCPLCGFDKIALHHTKALDKFIKQAKNIHGDKFNYDKVIYKGNAVKILITCPKHGDFEQSPANHLKHQGCPSCVKSRKYLVAEFIQKAKLTHQGKYSYVNSEYENSHTKLIITCPVHGDFEQSPSEHLYGRGCRQCAIAGNAEKNKKPQVKFIDEANKKHKGKYLYHRVNYINSHKSITITCPKHGDFEQKPSGHLLGYGCPKCYGRISSIEAELADFVKVFGFNVKTDKRLTAGQNDLRFDIIIESKKLVIEFNGVYWHSTALKARDYHQQKRKLAESLGYEMLSIWEDDYQTKKDKIQALIRRKLLGAPTRLFARKTAVTAISGKVALPFHRQHHIQETKPANASLHYALAHEGETVAVASFDKAGVLHRYTIKADTAVIGGIGKLIAAYRADHGNKAITTYCDKDYFGGGLYAATGFVKVSETLQQTYLHRTRRVRRENLKGIDLTGKPTCFNSGVEKLVLSAC